MLAYLTASRIPGRAANSIQVVKMAQALLTIDPNLLMTAVRGEGDASPEVLRSRYGVMQLPAIERFSAPGRFGIHAYNFRVARLARRRGADLVLSRSIGAAAITAGMGIPTVFECHAPPQGFERRYWRYLLKASGFRRIVVISHALRRVLIEHHPEAANLDLVVAPDGVDADRFNGLPNPVQAKREAGRDPGRLVAGYAGHLYSGRGIEVILELAGRLPGWDFLIVGGDDVDIEAVARSLRAKKLGNVELAGFVSNAELPRRLAIADVLLMPYQRRVAVRGGRLDTAAWMSPLKMFEYMAMGRAIVASDLPVLREILDDSTARMVAPERVEDWESALRELADERLRDQLASAARALVARYDWRHRVRLMLDGLMPVPARAMEDERLGRNG